MSRLSIAITALTAVGMFGAVVTSSAMALGPTWWENGSELLAGQTRTVDMVVRAGIQAHLEFQASGVKVEIACSGIEAIGGEAFNNEKMGEGKGKFLFKQCANVENCGSVSAEIEVLGSESELGTELVGPNVGALVDIFLANASNEFAKFNCGGVVGAIVALGANASDRAFACEWETGVTTSAKLHFLICPPLSSGLPWCTGYISRVENSLGNEEETGLEIDTLLGAVRALSCGEFDTTLLNALEEIDWDVK